MAIIDGEAPGHPRTGWWTAVERDQADAEALAAASRARIKNQLRRCLILAMKGARRQARSMAKKAGLSLRQTHTGQQALLRAGFNCGRGLVMVTFDGEPLHGKRGRHTQDMGHRACVSLHGADPKAGDQVLVVTYPKSTRADGIRLPVNTLYQFQNAA